MKKAFVFLSLVLICCLQGCSSASNAQAEAEAVAAAEKWLALVDGEKYVESWEEGSQLFKGMVETEQWAGAIESVRKQFGKKISREFKSSKYQTSLPGAPDGEYVVILFQSSFENKKSTIETVTPMLDDDGKWRVSGYYLK